MADKIASRPQEEQKDLHAEKGAKVKLVDLQQEKQLPVETRSRVPGIPMDRGEIILIIGEYGGRYYAGVCGRVYFPDTPPHAFEYIDKQQKYISREAWRRLAAMKGEEDEAARQYAMNRLNQIIREVQAED